MKKYVEIRQILVFSVIIFFEKLLTTNPSLIIRRRFVLVGAGVISCDLNCSVDDG